MFNSSFFLNEMNCGPINVHPCMCQFEVAQLPGHHGNLGPGLDIAAHQQQAQYT